MSYLTEEEKQQILFDWRYKGFTTLNLLTEEECDEINDELERLRKERQSTKKKMVVIGVIGTRLLTHIKILKLYKSIFHIQKLLK